MKCWCNGKTKESFRSDYLECVSCGTFISKTPTDPGYYDFDSYWHDKQTVDLGFPPIEQRVKDDFNNRIPFWGKLLEKIPKRKSILEIGGCHGGFLHHCEENGFKQCVGIEISEGTCDFARKTFGLEMICGDFPNVDIKGEFDIVCGFDVLEHFSDPFAALMKMKSLGKYVMLQTPCYSGQGLKFTHFKAGEHLYIFTSHSIAFLFSAVEMPILYFGDAYYPQDMMIIGGQE